MNVGMDCGDDDVVGARGEIDGHTPARPIRGLNLEEVNEGEKVLIVL